MATNATWQWKSDINLWQRVGGTDTSPYVDLDTEVVLKADWTAYQTFLSELKSSDPVGYYRYMSSCTYKWTQSSKEPTFAVIDPASVNMTPKNATVEIGKSVQLDVTTAPAVVSDPTVTYSSGNTAILTVDKDGLVTGIADGTAIVTAVVMSMSATSEVTVTAAS